MNTQTKVVKIERKSAMLSMMSDNWEEKEARIRKKNKHNRSNRDIKRNWQ